MATLGDVIIALKEGQLISMEGQAQDDRLAEMQRQELNAVRESILHLGDILLGTAKAQLDFQADQAKLERMREEASDTVKKDDSKPQAETAKPLDSKDFGLASWAGAALPILVGFSALWKDLNGELSPEFEKVKNNIQGVATGIVAGSALVGRLFGTIGAGIQRLPRLLRAPLNMLGSLGKIFAPLLRVTRIIPGIGQIVMGVFAIFDGLKAGIQSFKDNEGNLFRAVIDGVFGALGGIANGFVSLIELIPGTEFLTEPLRNFFNEFGRITTHIANLDIPGKIQDVVGGIQTFIENLVERVQSIVRMVNRKINELIDGVTTSEAERQANRLEAEARRRGATDEDRARARAARIRADLEDQGYDISQDQYSIDSLMAQAEANGERLAAAATGYFTRNRSGQGLAEQQGTVDRMSVSTGPTIVNAPTTNSNSTQVSANISNGGGARAPLSTRDPVLAN